MPYTRPDVRRSRSSTLVFSNERGPGTFVSMGPLPRRKPSNAASPTRKPPVFHIRDDDDDPSSTSPDTHDDYTPSTSGPNGSASQVPENSPSSSGATPFPRPTSPSPVRNPPSPPACPSPPRPSLPRGSSSPVLLSNGKPLKSSLKSSSSSPTICTDPQSQHTHQRTRSEPSTPAIPPKNVHFPDPEGSLATICVFNRSARPNSLNSPSNGDDTETDGKETPPNRFPFPAYPPVAYEIDTTKSSPVPSPSTTSHAHLHLESLSLSAPPSSSPGMPSKPRLSGSLIVRNLAYEKHVAVRFTLDDWQTVSEVSACYAESLPSLPASICGESRSATVGDLFGPQGRGWDRFTFAIRLEDYAYSLSTRTLWLAAHYRVDSTYPDETRPHPGPGGEWWDNNGGANYRIAFRPSVVPDMYGPPPPRPRRETAPAERPSVGASLVSGPAAATGASPRLSKSGLTIPALGSDEEMEMKTKKKTLPTPIRTGKLNLSNYAAPTMARSVSLSPTRTHFSSPSASSSGTAAAAPREKSPPPSLVKSAKPAPPVLQHVQTLSHGDEDSSPSPASSTLSTPTVSPVMIPRVIMDGQPITTMSEREHGTPSRGPGYVVDWDWSAKSESKGSPVRRSSPTPPASSADPDSDSRSPSQSSSRSVTPAPPTPKQSGSPPRRPSPSSVPSLNQFPGGQGLSGESLYKAFVTHWCFASPSLSPPHGYGGMEGGILTG